MPDIEKVMDIPLRAAKRVPRTQRAKRAVKEIRAHVVRHLKADPKNVWIDPLVNEKLWSRSIQKPPPRIRVKVVRLEGDEIVTVSLPEV
jgi:large subunit ribosomal protein L31e